MELEIVSDMVRDDILLLDHRDSELLAVSQKFGEARLLEFLLVLKAKHGLLLWEATHSDRLHRIDKTASLDFFALLFSVSFLGDLNLHEVGYFEHAHLHR